MCFYTYYKVHWLTDSLSGQGHQRKSKSVAQRGGGGERWWVWDSVRGSCCLPLGLFTLSFGIPHHAPKLVYFSLSHTCTLSLSRYTTAERRPAKRTKQLSQLTNQLMLFTPYFFFSISLPILRPPTTSLFLASNKKWKLCSLTMNWAIVRQQHRL